MPVCGCVSTSRVAMANVIGRERITDGKVCAMRGKTDGKGGNMKR